MSRWHHGVRGAFTRTLTVARAHASLASAATTLARADSFMLAATASSRSMTSSSAASPGALASICSDEPGTERQERRGEGSCSLDVTRANLPLGRRRYRSPAISRAARAAPSRSTSAGAGVLSSASAIASPIVCGVAVSKSIGVPAP